MLFNLEVILSFFTDDAELSSSSRSSSPEPGCVSPSVRDAINQEVRLTNHCHHHHCQCFCLILVLCRMDQDSLSLAQSPPFSRFVFSFTYLGCSLQIYELKFFHFLKSSAILNVLRAKFLITMQTRSIPLATCSFSKVHPESISVKWSAYNFTSPSYFCCKKKLDFNLSIVLCNSLVCFKTTACQTPSTTYAFC